MEKVLKLYTYNGDGVASTPFPNEEEQVVITDFQYEANRMGGASQITATVMHRLCLDDLWTDNVYAEFNGEKFFVLNTPSSNKDNEDARYEHEITLLSERELLNHVYFIDAVQGDSSADQQKSNTATVQFFGDVNEFVSRLNACFQYTRLNFNAVVDEGVTSDAVLVSFEDKYILEALQEIYNLYEIPYYFNGNTVHVGYTDSVVTYPMKYGFDEALLSISKENANYAVINKIKGQGSSDNIPYYYPNKSPKGDISIQVPSTNTSLKESDLTIFNAEKFAEVNTTDTFTYKKTSDVSAAEIVNTKVIIDGTDEWNGHYLPEGSTLDMTFTGMEGASKRFMVIVDVKEACNLYLNLSVTATPKNDMLTVTPSYSFDDWTDGTYVEAGTKEIYFNVYIGVSSSEADAQNTVSLSLSYDTSVSKVLAWTLNDKKVNLEDYGVRLSSSATVSEGDSFSQKIGVLIPSVENLMPSIYRESLGKEQFYEAKNNTYEDGEGGYYEFENEYSDTNQRQGTTDFEDIKPTIVGMTNARGQRMDKFIAFAYDENDNDEVDSDGNYIHPYFFAKLPKYDGENGFNLFDHAIEGENMTISFTSGTCGACSFEIGVGEETNKNIVQVDDSGNLKRDEDGNVLWEDQSPQDRQNDTQNYEVWIALKKDDSTYTNLMPNVNMNLKPSEDDTFVITNISLPDAYIYSAEKKLEQSLIKYMWENNKEKFTFSIKFSRIFFTEHPEVLEELNENSRILIEYNGQQHTLYVDSFTYKMTSDESLPEIEVTLADTLSVSQNSLQTQLDSVKQDILASLSGGDFLKQGLKYFLRKDINDYANGKITFKKGAEFGRYSSGILGSGGAVSVDENNNTYAEFDYLNIRKKATFTEITVQELKHIGGSLIISPAAMVISSVEETEDGYKCYFENKDDEGRQIYNEFEAGDQGRCQTFNIFKQNSSTVGNRYWWRLVTEIGSDYVVFSKEDCDEGSDVPQAGDEVAQLGNRNDVTRQNAQVYSAYGYDAPSRKMYQGIDSYSLDGKAIKEEYYDVTSGRFKEVTYGDSYVGAKDESTYVKYDQENGVEIKGKVSIESGSTGWNNLDGLESVINTVSDAANSAQKDAESAKEDAENASQEASEAKDRLDEWAKDSVISPTEKQALKQEKANLQSEYQTNIKNAEKYGIDTTEYTSAWEAYKKELEYHSADTPENIEISDTFATSQSAFYSSRESLLISIAQAAKEYADSVVSQIAVGAENLLLNTGFTGNYSVANLYPSTSFKSRTYLYSERLENWSGEGTVSEDSESASGYSCEIGSLSQQITLAVGESYVISYKAKGTSITSSIGSNTFTDSLTSEYQTFHHKFEYSSGSLFVISGTATVCEIKLERGTVYTDWCPSRKDKNEVADMFKNYWYLQDAMKGSTDIIGGLILSSMIQLGKWTDGVMEKVNAGVSGIYNDDTDVAFWAGGTFEQAIVTVQKLIGGENPSDDDWKSLAKFVATHGGDVFLRGYIYALGGYFRGMVDLGNGVTRLNSDGTGWIGKSGNGNPFIDFTGDKLKVNGILEAGAGSTIGGLTVNENGALLGYSMTVLGSMSGLLSLSPDENYIRNFIINNIGRAQIYELIFSNFTSGTYEVLLPNYEQISDKIPGIQIGANGFYIDILVPSYSTLISSSVQNNANYIIKLSDGAKIFDQNGNEITEVSLSKGDVLGLVCILRTKIGVGSITEYEVHYFIKTLRQ